MTGASQGIGRATAEALGAAGFDVVVHYRRHREEAERVAAAIRATGRSATLLPADLEAPDAPAAMGASVRAGGDSLDVLVHNAGEYPRQRFEETTEADFERQLRVHLLAPAALTRELLPMLRRSPRAAVVFVTSVLAYTGSQRGSPYAAAKAAQLGFARSLALELAPGITVNLVAPGAVDTAVLAGDTPERRRERVRRIPLGRLGTPADVAGAIAFLASPAARYITGETLQVNGGLRLG